MIEPKEIIPKLLEACPSAMASWDVHREYWDDEPAGHYNDVTVFAWHIVKSYSAGNTDHFDTFFSTVEHLLIDGSPEVQQIITIGLLEDIQTVSEDKGGYKVYEKWLGPQTKIAWNEIIALWEGKPSNQSPEIET